ncbi:MAG: GDSL-type esterase/lipase family protein [bacterium]|nr:GDSL-type esterase/lipase family protein [bacterium]
MDQLTPEQIELIVQFVHPEKAFSRFNSELDDSTISSVLGIDEAQYLSLNAKFEKNAHRAAQELLSDPKFAEQVDQLPFQPNDLVVGLGDSITDDRQSWLEILRHILHLRRPQDQIQIVNAGVSGDTTSQIISRFLQVAVQEPNWITCMAGTNDSRQHGKAPTKTLVSLEETEKNLTMLRNFAQTQTSAKWIWMTPTTVIENQIANHWFLSLMQMQFLNTDLAAIANVVRQQPDPVVDLQTAFGHPANPELLLEDGLHPSLLGHQAIVRALVSRLGNL